MGLDRSPTASTAVGADGTSGTARIDGAGMNHLLKHGVAGNRRPSTAPMGLHGFFGEIGLGYPSVCLTVWCMLE